jgi:hypothetical protein
VIAMLRETWWWPWWVSSLIDLTVAGVALVAFRRASRRALRALATVFVLAGLFAAVLAPVVMTDHSDHDLRNEPPMGDGLR